MLSGKVPLNMRWGLAAADDSEVVISDEELDALLEDSESFWAEKDKEAALAEIEKELAAAKTKEEKQSAVSKFEQYAQTGLKIAGGLWDLYAKVSGDIGQPPKIEKQGSSGSSTIGGSTPWLMLGAGALVAWALLGKQKKRGRR